MEFAKLQLHGFKSFVEPTTLQIESGLTGIIGPNGCGKSNLVEALRWVMGENSARRMRGQDMDDVIFGGTATRPARNVAEVALVLHNTDKTAPAEFNHEAEIEICRSIERERGSDYRINGRPVRQRDVQLLFADQATGAHSNNIVGQGQIDALIRAKPQDRRAILEEAAGTAGLQARRHEAELKLKAAEANLQRAQDVLNTLEAQQRGIKSQVRQAEKYRRLNETIRQTEMLLLCLRASHAATLAETANQQLAEAEAKVVTLTTSVTELTATRTALAAALPELRNAETTAALALQRIIVELEQNERAMQQLAREQQQLAEQHSRLTNDHNQSEHQLDDALATRARLQAEQTTLLAQSAKLQEELPTHQANYETLAASVHSADEHLQGQLRALAAAENQAKVLQQQVQQAEQQRHALQQRLQQLEQQQAHVQQQLAELPDLTIAKAMVDACETDLAKRQTAQEEQAQSESTAANSFRAAQQNEQQAREALTRLQAEAATLRQVLQSDANQYELVLDVLSTTAGYEVALAAALGEALQAATSDQAPIFWQNRANPADLPALPMGATSLASLLQAPANLQAALQMVGLVPDAATGHQLSAQLLPGQILVTADGWAWRWDGYTVTPQAPTAYATLLQQRVRLQKVMQEIEQATTNADQASTVRQEAEQAWQQSRQALQQAAQQVAQATKAAADARQLHTRQSATRNELELKVAHAGQLVTETTENLSKLATQLQDLSNAQAALPNLSELQQAATTQKLALAENRQQLAQAHNTLRENERELQRGQQRQQTIESEIASWQARVQKIVEQLDGLGTRLMEQTAQQGELREQAPALATTADELRDARQAAEANRQSAATALQTEEHKLQQAEQNLRQAEQQLMRVREDKIRAENTQQQASTEGQEAESLAEQNFQTNVAELRQQLPPELLEQAPARDEVQRQLQQALVAREAMGPVNLRAEIEAAEIAAQLEKLQNDHDDLVLAIDKLRTGISQLNREAREKLQQAFDLVNGRFQTLFNRLFNGGRAHLELVNADDPQQAGLEIFAAPPGKKVQALSLLSGGERTLTALALLFAVFQTNPSPVCVLDEAEAALDESNVDRFCTLVRDIAEETGTRFLIITHQRLTMARVNRLYGVTMTEKGVSQLVSVDLSQAEALRDSPAVPAAMAA